MSLELRNAEVSPHRNNEISLREKKPLETPESRKEYAEAEQKTKNIIFDYCDKMQFDISAKPMETIYSQNWDKIKLEKGLDATLKECNPNYELGKEWKTNCQRCVPTYEMRCRGYDVTAFPKPAVSDKTDLAFHPFTVWRNPEVIKCSKNGIDDIEKKMQEWGDGARAQVVVAWKNTTAGHTFIAERIDGKTVYLDPQTGNKDVKNYFKRVENGSVRLARIDTLDVSNKILDCCRKV